MASPYQIQEFRSRIVINSLLLKKVAYLDFPYQKDISDFLDVMDSLLREKNKRLTHRDNPPFRGLNKLFTALTPSLVHSFIPYRIGRADAPKPEYSRRMLGLQGFFYPSVQQIEQVTLVWLRHWIDRRFKEEVQTARGEDAFTHLLNRLAQPQTGWQIVDIKDLYENMQDSLLYKALPSILALRLAGQTSEILGRQITWQLTQEAGSYRFALVSQPLLSSFYDRWQEKQVEGYFAYHVEFSIQTVPGDPVPFVDTNISCRRYVESPMQRLMYQRRATIMVGTQTPRLNAWPSDPTLVPISIRGNSTTNWWDDQLPEMLSDLRARPLESVKSILDNPQDYWTPNEATGDRYFLLYSEGMEPDHPLQTGFGPIELHAVWQALQAHYADILIPEPLITRDVHTRRIERTLSMVPVWELNAKTKQTPRFSGGTKKQYKLTAEDKQQLGAQALQRTDCPLPLNLLIFYRTERVLQEIAGNIQTSFTWQCPELVVHPAHKIDDALVAPLSTGHMTPDFRSNFKNLTKKEREKQEKEWAHILEQSRRQRVREWRQLLGLMRPDSGTTQVIIEIPQESTHYEELNPRAAIREACIREGLGSQLLISFKRGGKADESRVKSALSDALIRQMGTFYGDITDTYCMAGVPMEVAEKLTVVGICRVRKPAHNLDYIVAVRILPSGRIEMLLPGKAAQWLPYQQACLELAEIFRAAVPDKTKGGQKALRMEGAAMLQFIKKVCLATEEPKVIIVSAQELRSLWTQLQNAQMSMNKLSFAPNEQPLEPQNLPPLWIYRLRESSTSDETPQYIQIIKDQLEEEEDANYAEGFFDLGQSGDFPVYHSIGRGPGSGGYKDWLKAADGGSRAFKHQHVLEAIPFFLSEGSLSQALARVIYLLRFSPSWEQGTTLYPLPNHLGLAAIDDYLCLLPSSEEQEEI